MRVPDNTPANTPVRLLLMPFTDWEWTEHITMTDKGGGIWTATAKLEEAALVHYAYDIWDEREWSEFQDKREAAAREVPVQRRLLHVSADVKSVSDVVAAWRKQPFAGQVGTILGRVADASGAAVVDSEVTVAGLHTATDWDGRFRVEVVAGTQRVTVYRADGAYKPASIAVEVPAGGEVTANLSVEPAAKVPVTFRVQLPAGTPEDLEIRLAGSMRQLGSWRGDVNTPYVMGGSSDLPVLKRTGPDTAEGVFLLREGSYIQYFYTLTSEGQGREWGGPPWNQRFRTMVVGSVPQTRADRVASWKNPDWPTITFRATVPPNTPEGVPIIFEMGPSHRLTRTGPRTWQLSISSVPNSNFRYRYLLGGDGIGADSSGGLEGEGFRTARLGTKDVVVDDVITRWANLPAVSEAGQGARVRVTFNASVPHATPVNANVRWVPDGAPAVSMQATGGNPWLYRAEVELPAGTPVSYRIDLEGGQNTRGPTRHATPRYAGEVFNDWVGAWEGSVGKGGGTRPGYLAGYYTPDFWSPNFLSLSDTTFASIAAHNGNLVAVSSVWSYGRIKPSPVIEPRAVEAPSVLTPRKEILDQIAIARRHGLQVLLAPQFNMEMSPGGINALNDNSTKWWNEWLTQAERLWMWNAQIAQETNAEMLLLPGFVFHVFAQPWAFESPEAFKAFDDRVAALVAQVRTVYKGKVLISGGVRESQVPGLADYVGVTTYDTGHPELPASATVQQWREAYEKLFAEKLDPIHDRWGKPVFFYTIHLPSQKDDPEPGGQSLQARRLEGLMQALDTRPWVAGSMSWAYGMVPAPLAQSDGLRGRLAEAVLAKYYGRFTGAD
ncbi:MAG: hypothetical protein HY678_00690 [Chloroflexi bacterium]|nr:hypothetical protein [Chloroflexota bacterium]